MLGPTSSGKSEITIRLAKKFGGEILSADSRQIYRGLDIGSGKEPGKWITNKKYYLSENIPHYGIDIVSPKTSYSVARFKKYADRVITDILKRKKVPIICGGTGFWIKAIVDDISYPKVKPDPVLRSMLRNKTAKELFGKLEKLDPERAKTIDSKNPVRLIRAIEICKKIGRVPKPSAKNPASMTEVRPSNFLQIGISLSKEKLHENIQKRLRKRFAAGMVEEVKKLHYKNKLSWKKLESFGLGYKLIPQYLRGEITSKDELFEKVYQVERKYAKRQMTWFLKDPRIVWLQKYCDIEKEVQNFLQ